MKLKMSSLAVELVMIEFFDRGILLDYISWLIFNSFKLVQTKYSISS